MKYFYLHDDGDDDGLCAEFCGFRLAQYSYVWNASGGASDGDGHDYPNLFDDVHFHQHECYGEALSYVEPSDRGDLDGARFVTPSD